MSFFHHEESPNPSKRCRFLKSTFKDAFANCHTFCRKLASPSPEEEGDSSSNYEDEQEVFVSAVRSKYMEAKSRRKGSVTLDSFTWVFSPTTEKLLFTPKGMQQEEETSGEEKEDFYSVDNRFSRCSSLTSAEAYLSVKPNFSRCSSLSRLDFTVYVTDFQRRSIIQAFCQCQGWPFGLCRKALLLPPLPKSPSESWLWCKSTRIIKLP